MGPAGYGDSVEGIHAVAAAIAAGRVEHLWVERSRAKRPDVAALVEAMGAGAVELVDEVRRLAHTEAPQGVVARCTPLRPVPADRLMVPGAAVVVLDHVEDPHNLGAVARSAAAAGMTGLAVSGRRAAPLSAAAFKAAAGALERLPVAVVGSIPDLLSRFRRAGVWSVGLDSGGDRSLFGLELLTEPVAVVVGAEGRGLSRLTRERCDALVHIPMAASTESLNASVAAALACYEVMRIRG